MTRYLLCDYCGEPIEEDEQHVMISATGSREATHGGLYWEAAKELLGHFHATLERCCYDELVDQMLLVMETHSDLQRIPTASSHRIARLRAKHRRPTGGEG
jgi:hypothetical protein